MLNRRTFIKAIGLTTLSIPALATLPSNDEPKWHRFNDDHPKIGQVFVWVSYCSVEMMLVSPNPLFRKSGVDQRVEDVTRSDGRKPRMAFRGTGEHLHQSIYTKPNADAIFMRKINKMAEIKGREWDDYLSSVSRDYVNANLFWTPINQIPDHLPKPNTKAAPKVDKKDFPEESMTKYHSLLL